MPNIIIIECLLTNFIISLRILWRGKLIQSIHSCSSVSTKIQTLVFSHHQPSNKYENTSPNPLQLSNNSIYLNIPISQQQIINYGSHTPQYYTINHPNVSKIKSIKYMQVLPSRPITLWEPTFRANVGNFVNGPVRTRPCRDVWCLLILAIMFIGLIVVSFDSTKNSQIVWKSLPGSQLMSKAAAYIHIPIMAAKTVLGGIISGFLGHVISLIIAIGLVSILTSFTFFLLLQKFPRALIWTSLVILGLILFFMLVGCIIAGKLLAALIFTILLAVYLCVLYAFRHRLEATVVLVKLTSVFMFQNMSVYFIPLMMGLITMALAIILVFSIGTTYAMEKLSKISQYQATGYYGFQIMVFSFFAIFFYYVLVYMVASAVANWFYMRGKLSPCAGFPGILYQIGSLTFAAVVVTILKIVRAIFGEGSATTGNFLSYFCFCVLQCFFGCLQGLLQVMNHFAVITMTVTGQDFLQSSKSAGVILFSEFPLFAIMSTVDITIYLIGLLFINLLPVILVQVIATMLDINLIFRAVLAAPTISVSFMVSLAFISTFSQAMNSLFVFYALEMKLVEYGLRTPPISNYNVCNAEIFVESDLCHLAPKQMMDLGYPIISTFR